MNFRARAPRHLLTKTIPRSVANSVHLPFPGLYNINLLASKEAATDDAVPIQKQKHAVSLQLPT